MRLSRHFLALLAAPALALGGCAQQSGVESAAARPALDEAERRFAADFDTFITSSMTRLATIPGLSVAVARGDGPIFTRGYGLADIERNVPATASTRFYIASSTKSFVALALALLDRRGVVDLDWTLAELAPGVAFAPELRAGEVTLRHLLSHSHGLSSEVIQFRLAYSGQHDSATLWRLLPSLRPNRQAPLGTFDYGNIGYNIAALLIERRLGRTWQDILQDEVLAPLGARETHSTGLEALRSRHAFAAPYFGAGPSGPERLPLLKIDSNMQSAGGMFSSANDLARWVALQLAARRGTRRLPFPAEVVAATHEPVATTDASFGPFRRTGYGLGWYSGPYGGETLYHSFGGYSGARSHVSFMPARDLGVAILTNDEGAGSVFVDIAAAYAYAWFAEGPAAAQAQVEPMMEQLLTRTRERTASIAADRERRASRTWRLRLPRQAYSGRYCSAEMGTIEVAADAERIAVAMGAMNSIATPFTEPDSIRVEMIPYQGAPMSFVTEGDRVVALRAFDTIFRKCG
ncbi:serine hydrolase domain-containing protein [Allosphingosinicella sp.]|jgi:CubicO group peptidase (beta-lactamase class C family)|uniref:serine hydrolase domain-containing protein n=1 Tax=Allosphingosinicella sp. TaxID=2823234 RepID=UPI002EF4E5EE